MVGHADSGIDVQEFLVTPVKRNTFKDGVEKVANIYHTLKKILAEKGIETAVGDEGDFAPKFLNTIASFVNSSKRSFMMMIIFFLKWESCLVLMLKYK